MWRTQIEQLMTAKVVKPYNPADNLPVRNIEPIGKALLSVMVLLEHGPKDTNEITDLLKTCTKESVRQRLDKLRDRGLVKRQLTGSSTPAIWSLVKQED